MSVVGELRTPGELCRDNFSTDPGVSSLDSSLSVPQDIEVQVCPLTQMDAPIPCFKTQLQSLIPAYKQQKERNILLVTIQIIRINSTNSILPRCKLRVRKEVQISPFLNNTMNSLSGLAETNRFWFQGLRALQRTFQNVRGESYADPGRCVGGGWLHCCCPRHPVRRAAG